MAEDKEELKPFNIPFSGKLNTVADPTELALGDFQQLTNMRYGAKAPKSVSGMTKINASGGSVTCNIITTNDDTRTYATGSVFVQAGSLNIGYLTAGVMASSFRFINVAVPNAATITSAYIKLTEMGSDGGTTVPVRIYAEDQDSPTAPTSYADFNARTMTTAYADWNISGAWVTDTVYTSPTIATVIQEIVNRAGWVSGNAIQIFIKDNGGSGTNYRNIYDYTTGPSKVAQLVINYSSASLATVPMRRLFHFIKSQPAETHLMAQTWDAGITDSDGVYDNTTAIPNSGDFNSTRLFQDSSGASVAFMSNSPDGTVAYCNGKDSCIWGGNEFRCSGFVLSDSSGTTKFDYTKQVQSTLSDTNDVATLVKTASSLDANTSVLFHFDDAFTGASPADAASKHSDFTNTAVIPTTTAGEFKFTQAAKFDGATSYFTHAHHADFDLSSNPSGPLNKWTIDFWVNPSSAATVGTIYYKGTDATHYMEIELLGGPTYRVRLKIYDGVDFILLGTPVSSLTADIFSHVEVVEDADDYYIFINGFQKAHTSNAIRPGAFTGGVFIGVDGPSGVAGTNFFKGELDEFEIRNGTAVNTSPFIPPTQAYVTAAAYVYIAAQRPIKGVKFYILSGNTQVSAPTVKYWTAGVWTDVSNIVDTTSDTATKTKTLNQTGSISFDSTVSTAKPRMFNNVFAYWYQFTFPSIDDTTTVYYCTIDAPFQQVVDLWDGALRPISSAFKYHTATSRYMDETINVLNKDYAPGDLPTYSVLAVGNGTAPTVTFPITDSLFYGFVERSTGINVAFVTSGGATPVQINRTNTHAANMTVQYWNGFAWTAVTGLVDGTREELCSFGKNGSVTWDAPESGLESKTSISVNTAVYYYYKITFDDVLSSAVGVFVDQVQGIPAPKKIHGYSYPVSWQNRLWLLNNNSDQKNSAICTAQDTICVFNGEDAIGPEAPMTFGNDEPLICGASMFTRYGGNIFQNLIILKKNELWVIDGTTPGDYKRYQVSTIQGCVAPGTLQKCDMGYEMAPGLLHHVLIWQSDSAICMFDGNSVTQISGDISNYFDRTQSEAINDDMIHKSEAFYDPLLNEYHWLFASGSATTLDKEWVYDLAAKKWFEIDRGTGKKLQTGCVVHDTNGLSYAYGSIDTGYVEYLENGTTFDGNSIISTLWTGDIALGKLSDQVKIRKVSHFAVSKSNANSVTLSHYGDCNNTADTRTVSCPLLSTTLRVVKKTESLDWGDYDFHSFKATVTTTNETVAYEPLGIDLKIREIRQELK